MVDRRRFDVPRFRRVGLTPLRFNSFLRILTEYFRMTGFFRVLVVLCFFRVCRARTRDFLTNRPDLLRAVFLVRRYFRRGFETRVTLRMTAIDVPFLLS